MGHLYHGYVSHNPMIMMFSEKSAWALLCAIFKVFGYRADGWHWFLGLYVPQLIWTWLAATLYFATLCHTLSVKHVGIRLEVLTLYVEAQAGDQQHPSGLWSDTLHHILDGLSTWQHGDRMTIFKIFKGQGLGRELWNKNCMWWVLVGALVSLALEPYLSDPFSISASILRPGDGDGWRPHEVCDWPGGRAGAPTAHQFLAMLIRQYKYKMDALIGV